MQYKSLLHKMAATTPTEFWNDSCSASELRSAIDNGATGATTNPLIVLGVLKKEMDLWRDRILELIRGNPTATEDDVAWLLNEEMAVKGARFFEDIFRNANGKKGRISLQTNAKFYRNAEAMWQQAVYFNGLAPNMQIKIPATGTGIEAIEEATYRGVSVNATVSFSVPQAVAVAEAVQRGMQRRTAEGNDTSAMSPVCTLMLGRIDDHLKLHAEKDGVACDAGVLGWGAIACFKRAYQIYQERKYPCRLLAASFRSLDQYAELVGGDVVLTLTAEWQDKINTSGIEPEPRMDVPVDAGILDALLVNFPEFRRMYEPDGMSVSAFEEFVPAQRILYQFLGGYADLVEVIRGMMLPFAPR